MGWGGGRRVRRVRPVGGVPVLRGRDTGGEAEGDGRRRGTQARPERQCFAGTERLLKEEWY